MSENKISFLAENGEKVEFEIFEQTKLNGNEYLLVSDQEDEEAYIMQKIKEEGTEEYYEFVEDDAVLHALSKVFEELLEDVEII